MQKNRLGKSDIYISELTLGCMSLGTDERKAKRIVEAALDRGINHLDTADLYDFGLNEEIIGEIIKDKRQDIILTTKAGNHFSQETRDWFWDPSKAYILEAAKQSLKRLDTDYIDFFMLHGGTIDDPMEETIAAMEELKQAGLIRAYGISSIRPNVIQAYVEQSSIDGVMLQYSILDRRPEERILGLLEENQISAIARGPLAKGMLTERYEDSVATKGENGFLDYNNEELLATIKKLDKASDLSLHELAIKYILRHPAIATVTFGASTVEQVLENTEMDLSKVLPDSLYMEVQEISRANLYEDHRA